MMETATRCHVIDHRYSLVCREYDFSVCPGISEPAIDQIRFQQVGRCTGNSMFSARTIFAKANAVIGDGKAGMCGAKCAQRNLDLSAAFVSEAVAEGVDDRLAGHQHQRAALIRRQ
jgi:hypothetical protein